MKMARLRNFFCVGKKRGVAFIDEHDEKFDFRLQAFLREKLSNRDLRISRIPIKCASLPYRADPGPYFIKVRARQSASSMQGFIDFLKNFDLPDMPFVAKSLIENPLIFEDTSIVIQSWQDGAFVDVPDLLDSQVISLVSAYKSLQHYFMQLKTLDSVTDTDKLYSDIDSAISRNGFFGKLIGYFRQIPLELRSYVKVVPVHGDFHIGNVGFAKNGGDLSAFYDLESVRPGSPVEDLLYLVTDRYKSKSMGRNRRRKLEHILCLMISRFGYPKEEWLRALNILRMKVVAKRVCKYKWNPIVIFDSYQRDRPLRHLISVISRC